MNGPSATPGRTMRLARQGCAAPRAEGNVDKRAAAVVDDDAILTAALGKMNERIRAIEALGMLLAGRRDHFGHPWAAVRVHGCDGASGDFDWLSFHRTRAKLPNSFVYNRHVVVIASGKA